MVDGTGATAPRRKVAWKRLGSETLLSDSSRHFHGVGLRPVDRAEGAELLNRRPSGFRRREVGPRGVGTPDEGGFEVVWKGGGGFGARAAKSGKAHGGRWGFVGRSL